MEQAIALSHLRKAYRGVLAVDDVSFEVTPNEIFGIIGANGSGKTTTVECLQGLRTADRGEIRVLGMDPRTEGEALRRRIGSQLQESALPDRLKVWEALDLFATASANSTGWQAEAREWGIYDRRNAAFADLSGGERQRLFIALALITKPELVFLDEMTTGLDPAARRVAWSLIEDVRRRGATVVLVTHFMDEAEHLCDRIGVFRSGRVVDVDSPSRLIAKHNPSSRVRFSTDQAELSWLDGVSGVKQVERRGARVEVTGTGPLLAHVAGALVARGIAPPDLRVDLPTLEDAYMAITEEGSAS